jgi:hypothetical protein
MRAMIDLDAWLPDPQIVTRHSRTAAVAPDRLWAAARNVRLDQTRTIGRLVRWRIPGVPAEQSFMGLLAEEPFTVLHDGERHSISGLCGRIWTFTRDYGEIASPDDFRAWAEPHTVRVLFGHWVTPGPQEGESTLHSEARVEPVDRIAGMRLRALWLAVGPFERLIGAEALTLAVAQAQSRAHA